MRMLLIVSLCLFSLIAFAQNAGTGIGKVDVAGPDIYLQKSIQDHEAAIVEQINLYLVVKKSEVKDFANLEAFYDFALSSFLKKHPTEQTKMGSEKSKLTLHHVFGDSMYDETFKTKLSILLKDFATRPEAPDHLKAQTKSKAKAQEMLDFYKDSLNERK